MTAQPAPPPAAPAVHGTRRWRRRAAAVAALASGAGLLTLVPGAAAPAAASGLVPWTDCDAMLAHYRAELVRTATPYGIGGHGFGRAESSGGSAPGTRLEAQRSAGADSAAAGSSTGEAVGTGPTGTNLQEAGVDEPDTVKLSGDLVLAVGNGRLQVVRGGRTPTLLSSLPLGALDGPAELLVDGSRVLVVASGWRPVPGAPSPGPLPGPAEAGDSWSEVAVDLPARTVLAAPGRPYVRLLLVDLAEPAEPRVRETLELDGTSVSARLVDGTVRLVTRSTPHVPAVSPEHPGERAQEDRALAANRRAAARATVEQVLPTAVRRDADGTEITRAHAVGCNRVHHPAGTPAGATTLLVTTLRPAAGLAAVDTTAVTSDGDLVYASTDRLHVATSRWGTVAPAADTAGRPVSGSVPADQVTTELHAFDTSSPEQTRYLGSGSVPGYLYGRWALSHHEGHLRVATTTAAPWDGSGTSSSSMVVLAEQGGRLVERGRLDGLGPTEQIYAVRYVGDLATVVTFRQTDPLYVLDLSDPAQPRLRGELKVPGFSTYLHPVGDDRLLGVGQDADSSGRVTGVQLSLFDLSDLSAPRQVHRLSLGEGWSPALDDSRAFGFDPGRRLAVLPFSSWSRAGGASTALGVRVDGDRLVEAGRLAVGPENGIERVLLGADTAYALSFRGVVAMDPASMQRTGSAAYGG